MKVKRITLLILTVAIVIAVACSDVQQPEYMQPTEDIPESVQITVTPEPTPSPDPEPVDDHVWIQPDLEDESTSLESDRDKSIIIAIDPGHQRRGNSAQEPLGPGSSETKAMVASGTVGVATNVPEYELTLEISLLLRDMLIERGYEVFMIRDTHDVDISNKTRAEMAAESGAQIFVRIHANGSADASVNGILTISPTSNSPFIPHLSPSSFVLSHFILEEMIITTGANNMGIWETDTMTGINWSTIPVTIVELGFMTNPEEDRLMQTPEYQQKLVEGMANGIDLFFNIDFGE